MYATFDDLCKAISTNDLKKGEPFTVFLSKCLKRYFAAQEASKAFGFVGVGCITFAEARLVEFQRRAGKFKHKIGETVWVAMRDGSYEAQITGYGMEGCDPVYDVVTATGQTRWCYKAQIDG
jgi:hypothetical protein